MDGKRIALEELARHWRMFSADCMPVLRYSSRMAWQLVVPGAEVLLPPLIAASSSERDLHCLELVAFTGQDDCGYTCAWKTAFRVSSVVPIPVTLFSLRNT